MKLSLCTISFRHQLISIDQLVEWAKQNSFHGIELWGTHAINLAEQPHYNKEWLSNFGLSVSMISDYLPLIGPEHEVYTKVHHLCRLAKHWGACKLRTFAGGSASLNTSMEDRQTMVMRLRDICDWTAQHNIRLIVEIHPNTLADNIQSTLQLLEEVNHSNLKINFDVLHVWESNIDPIVALEKLASHVEHFHLKNIRSAEFLGVFSPPNVYSASGSREGMVPIFEGAVNYQEFLAYVCCHKQLDLWNLDASLEWFGNQSKKVLRNDRYHIQKLEQHYQLTQTAV